MGAVAQIRRMRIADSVEFELLVYPRLVLWPPTKRTSRCPLLSRPHISLS